MSIAERVHTLLVETMNVSPAQIRPDACLYAELGFDSLDHVEFLMAVEDHFELDTFSDDECERILTVSDVIAAVERKLAVPA